MKVKLHLNILSYALTVVQRVINSSTKLRATSWRLTWPNYLSLVEYISLGRYLSTWVC